MLKVQEKSETEKEEKRYKESCDLMASILLYSNCKFSYTFTFL